MYLSPKALIGGLAMAAYTGLVVWVSSTLGLPSNKAWLLRIVLIAIGLIALGVILWVIKVKKAKPKPADEAAQPAAGGSPDEIDYLVGIAEDKLKSAKLAKGRIGTLPALLLVGEAGSGKTSVALNCGLDPEHLAGQIFQGDAVAATDSINLWFARRAILVEAAESVLSDPGRWARLVRRVAPARLGSVFGGGGQAPRALVVCFDCESFKTASVDAITSRARNLQARLREASEILGTSLPVYVFFTRADSLPFFGEYVAGLSDPEAGQVLGVTLPVQDYRTGLYVQDQTNRLNAAYEGIFKSLDEHRADYLAREQDPDRLPGIYEFPREFRKLQPRLVQLMVELCRPSHLTAGPFLRGFYFTGVRMVLEEARPSIGPGGKSTSPAAPVTEPSSVGATQVFNARQWQSSPSTAARRDATLAGATKIFSGGLTAVLPGGTLAQPEQARWVPQWCFLSHLFGDLVLQDHSALGVSGSSSKVSFWRRALLATAAAVFLVCCVGFTISYIGNHELEKRVSEAEKQQFVASSSGQAPSTSDLQRLDSIGNLLEELGNYDSSPPMHLDWELYSGEALYPRACKAYATGFSNLLLSPTQNALAGSLKLLSFSAPASAPTGKNVPPPSLPDYAGPYKELKTYLITTSQSAHVKEDPSLASDLYSAWPPGATAQGDTQKIASAQVARYAALLAGTNSRQCFNSAADSQAVTRAQTYLGQFPPAQRVYQAMLTDAAKGAKDVNFNRDFPGSDQVVINRLTVPAAFTSKGWQGMQEALKHPADYAGGEPWVLGPNSQGTVDPQTLVPELTQKYHDEFVKQWKAFLAASRFAGYGEAGASADKIGKVVGGNSPLLMTFCVVREQTDDTVQDVQDTFAPARSLEDAGCREKLAGQASGLDKYADNLFSLGTCIAKVETATTPTDQDTQRKQCQEQVIDDNTAVSQLVAKNPGPPDVSGAVEGLLKAPIEILAGKAKGPPPSGAKDLCAGFKSLSAKFPNDGTMDDFQNIFQPGTGLLDKFAPPSDKAGPHYKGFWANADAIRKALYPPGSKSLQMAYTITALQSPGVNGFSLKVGSSNLNTFGSSKSLVWRGDAQETVDLAVGSQTGSKTGSFDIFQFVAAYGENGRLTPQGYTFDIRVAQTLGSQTTNSGKLNLNINAGAASELFESGALGKLGCIANVSQ